MTALVLAGGVIALRAPAAHAQAPAQPPANDDFDAATAITAPPFTSEQDTTEATDAPDDPDPTCVVLALHTVWYTVTPPTDMTITANTFGSDYDTNLSVWTGQRGALTQLACNDNAESLQSSVTFEAAAGEPLYVMAASAWDSPGGHLVLNVGEVPPPVVLGLTVDPTGQVTADAATIHVTVTCSRPIATVSLTAALRQQAGGRVTVGYAVGTLDCPGEVPWRATLVGETGRFRRGEAQATVALTAFDPERQQNVRARAVATVRLHEP